MRRLSIISLVLLVAGCGSGVTDPPSARDRVTRDMRDACSVHIGVDIMPVPDSEISTRFIAFDIMWEEGLSKLEAMLVNVEACATENNPETQQICDFDVTCLVVSESTCMACNASIIDAVWR